MTAPVLLLDAGSTSLKWCWWQDGRLVEGGRMVHRGGLVRAVETIPQRAVARVLVASVLYESSRVELTESLAVRFGVNPVLAHPAAEACGVVNGYIDPPQLGVDRWLALIAARRQGSGGKVVVDCGTAVTVDVLDATGRHLGGQIIPGLGAMYRCLGETTRLSPQLDEPGGPLGRDTGQCVASGVHYALAGAVDRAVSVLPVDTEDETRVIMTGGDAARLGPLVRGPIEIRPHLVIEGLARWAGLDQKK